MPHDKLCKRVQEAREEAFWANEKAQRKELLAIEARKQAKQKSEEYAELRFKQYILLNLHESR